MIAIERVNLETETLGSLYGFSGSLLAKTMELPWRDNDHNVSCIPLGVYWVHLELTSPKHPYPHYRVEDVPGRLNILWHKITFVKDLLGCTGIGSAFADLNKDGVPDIIQSTVALENLVRILPKRFQCEYRMKQ